MNDVILYTIETEKASKFLPPFFSNVKNLCMYKQNYNAEPKNKTQHFCFIFEIFPLYLEKAIAFLLYVNKVENDDED